MDASMFRGSTVALVTPFDENGDIDEDGMRRLVDWHIQEGTDVLLVCGTTGESATLTDAERFRAMEIVIQQAGGRVPVMCGTGTNSTRHSIELTRKAEELGADAVLLVCPYYNKPTQEGLYRHFSEVAAATSLPVVVYNVPGRTGTNISAETLLRLAEVPNIVGVKEASGNFSQIMEILRRRPSGFLVLSGDDALTLPMMALGADGVISVVANEVPGLFSRMVHAALEGDWKKAREIHFRLLPLMEANFIESNPIPVKAALAMMGRIREQYHLPLCPMKEENRQKLRSILRQLELI
jgi:4-hydroxy-tetrahydrodipicolinate synthase